MVVVSLTVLDARPIYSIYSALSSEFPGPVFDITSVDFDKHSPRRGQDCTPFLQLQLGAFVLRNYFYGRFFLELYL